MDGDQAPNRIRVETRLGPVSLDRTGDGPHLVLLHSLLSDRHVFDPVVPALARVWTVDLVDLPGFGDTRAVAPEIDAYADLVGALLADGGLAGESTVVAGNGLGAFVALGTAIRHGGAFGRLLLVGCGSGFPDAGRTVFARMADTVESHGMPGIVDTAVLRIFTAEYLDAHPEARRERTEVLSRTDPAAFVTACRALHDLDYSMLLDRVRNPTLIVVGSEDAATPPPLARSLAADLPDARLVEMPGVAHAPQLQAPNAFLDAVAGFLELPPAP